MISEHQFSVGYPSVWRQVTPLNDGFWHIENMRATRIEPPLAEVAPKFARGVINELSFLAFCDLTGNTRADDLATIATSVSNNAAHAVRYVNRVSAGDDMSVDLLDSNCHLEAALLASRMLRFFVRDNKIVLRPQFSGCGLLSRCEGDVLFGDCLYEVKAGDRPFRIADLCQLLVYAALAYADQALSFSRIGIFNPRTGMSWSKSLDHVCMDISGLRANDTLPALIEQFSAASASR